LINYLDASAAAKLIIEEAESTALASYLDDLGDDAALISSALLETELRRLAIREELNQSTVSGVLDRIDLVEPNRSVFHQAGLFPGPRLRTLDALHLATALAMGSDSVIAYDARLLIAAAELGIATASPS
jgi:uncharacterized protein